MIFQKFNIDPIKGTTLASFDKHKKPMPSYSDLRDALLALSLPIYMGIDLRNPLVFVLTNLKHKRNN